MGAGLTFTVAITSLNRPDELEKCLQAVAAMDRMPDNLLVALHREDHASTEVASAAGADVFYVEAPGLAVAVEAAIRHATNDVVCFVDDDARPHPDWLDRIANHFESDEKLGFLGGRDNVDGDCESGAESLLVGRITATGKVVGNHHLGKGESRRADLLKGANMSVRRTPAVNIPLG